jgi:hypothetical protein
MFKMSSTRSLGKKKPLIEGRLTIVLATEGKNGGSRLVQAGRLVD